MQYPSKFQWHFYRDWKINPKVHLEAQKTLNSKGNTDEKVQCWGYRNTWLQTILHSHSNKNSTVLAQNRHKDQWHRREDTDKNSCSYAHLIFWGQGGWILDFSFKQGQFFREKVFHRYCLIDVLFYCCEDFY
jgi:hypothetical protein